MPCIFHILNAGNQVTKLWGKFVKILEGDTSLIVPVTFVSQTQVLLELISDDLLLTLA